LYCYGLTRNRTNELRRTLLKELFNNVFTARGSQTDHRQSSLLNHSQRTTATHPRRLPSAESVCKKG
ncbi:Uncharacterized protein APZ42_010435, partial [Daphnia magna]